MGSATTLLSRMRKRAKTIPTLSTWRTPERRTSRRKFSSKSSFFLDCHHFHQYCPHYHCSPFAAKACCCACWATCWRSSPTRPSSSPSQSPTGSASSGSADQNILFETLASRLERARRWLCSALARWSEQKDLAQSSSSLGWIDIRFGWINKIY